MTMSVLMRTRAGALDYDLGEVDEAEHPFTKPSSGAFESVA